MLLERLYVYARLLVVLLVVATEGKKRKSRRKETLSDAPQGEEDTPEIENICDISSPVIIYCYCNNIEVDSAEEGNCWIFNDTSDETFVNVWEGFSTQSKIKHLTLHLRPDGTLKRIPTVAVLHLPDLQWFEVQYATVNTVHAFGFGNSTSVEKIALARNSIKVLEPHSFANLPKVATITLGENQLTEINRTVFTNLPALTRLYIDRNNITNIEDFAFQELSNLTELEIFSNQIQAIVPETFKGLYSLERLDLHKNWIEVLGDMTFQDLSSLKHLDLQGNSIKYIAPKSFYGLNKLQKLVLQDNKLMSLGSEVFKYTPDLLHLDLRQNVLETLTRDTMKPILTNLNKRSMNLYIKRNVFRCDTRLLWMFALHNSTSSRTVKTSLEEVFCYLESGTLPTRLDDVQATPIYEITTMGIGPRTELLKLRPSELPDPLVKTPATFTTEENCDHDESEVKLSVDEDAVMEKPRRGKGKGRGRGRKHKPTEATPSTNEQNDMASDPSKQKHMGPQVVNVSPQQSLHQERPAAPVHDSRPLKDTPSSASTPSNSLLLLVLLTLLPLLNKPSTQ